MTPILNKKQNYDLWQSGAFGNKLRAWRTITEWRLAGGHTDLWDVKVALRTLREGGGPCRYNLEPCDVDNVAMNWMDHNHVLWEQIMVNEMAPDSDLIMQGEYLNGICQDEEGFALWGYFFYSTVKHHMRDALRIRPEHTYGLRADVLLRRAMTDASYEDWRVLLDQYPEHVLEVSIYDRCLGDIPGRNALVWEVRRY
jgi:hypothetical protein